METSSCSAGWQWEQAQHLASEGSLRGHSSRTGEFQFSAFDKKLCVQLLHSTQMEPAAAACGSKLDVGIPVEEHLTLALLLGVCASSAAHGASSSLFPLQLLLVFVPSESRWRNALLNIVQSFLFHYSWLHEQPKMHGKVSREQYDVKCPTILKIYCWRNCACIYF